MEQLNICKSCGPDNVTSLLLKECANSISSPLCTLFNKQLRSGCFPKMWKVANLVLVFKSGDKEMVENYRGISLLCIISKVLEKCLFSCVFPFSLFPALTLPSTRQLCQRTFMCYKSSQIYICLCQST